MATLSTVGTENQEADAEVWSIIPSQQNPILSVTSGRSGHSVLNFRLLSIIRHASMTCLNGQRRSQLLALVQKGRPVGGACYVSSLRTAPRWQIQRLWCRGGRLDGRCCVSWKNGRFQGSQVLTNPSVNSNSIQFKKKNPLYRWAHIADFLCKYTMMVLVVDMRSCSSWVWTFHPWLASENNYGILQHRTLWMTASPVTKWLHVSPGYYLINVAFIWCRLERDGNTGAIIHDTRGSIFFLIYRS